VKILKRWARARFLSRTNGVTVKTGAMSRSEGLLQVNAAD
jgi:hypothetical protein